MVFSYLCLFFTVPIRWFGMSAKGSYDLDGNGYDDLAVGAPGSGDVDQPSAFVLFSRGVITAQVQHTSSPDILTVTDDPVLTACQPRTSDGQPVAGVAALLQPSGTHCFVVNVCLSWVPKPDTAQYRDGFVSY